ncbi:MAG: ABC transporter substrate-binding protein, partial [Deltaproteobacteria bacterium]|nr:ABC transporter substrate-binding protein [Deltaproteobacteria bacterium]
MTAGVVPGATAAAKGGTLIIGFEAEPTSLDAHHGGASVIDRQSNTPIYDALVEAKFDGSGVRPALAERWKISGEGKVYTFYLRKGVKFHDGTPFNAEAVKFNYDRILDK